MVKITVRLVGIHLAVPDGFAMTLNKITNSAGNAQHF
jgi:hypothetical protein